MPTYTIVAEGTDPLGPNESEAGDAIQVSDGDVFIIDPSADSNITFQADGGIPADFVVVFSGSNSNDFNIKVEDDLSPTFDIPHNTDLGDINLDAKAADSLEFTAGDNVSFGQFDGSTDGPNTAMLGPGFTTDKDWKFGNDEDELIVGDDATFENIDTGDGDDTIVFGDRATTSNIETKEGNDSVRTGDDYDGGNIKTGKGNDTVYTGDNAQANEIDGGEGNDTYTTETSGTNSKNMESTSVVCYAPGTLIDTPDGRRAIETLCPGDLVLTLDHGPQPIRWIRSSDHPLEEAEIEDKPVLIQSGALGNNIPAHDLIVSPQHRILVGGGGQLAQYFDQKAFVPAKALTSLPGIRHMSGKKNATWIHFACNRHEVITANGCLSESLLLGPMVINGLTCVERRTLTKIFGRRTMPGTAFNGLAAFPCLTAGNVRRQTRDGATTPHTAAANEVRKWDRDAAMERYEADRLRDVVLGKQARRATAA